MNASRRFAWAGFAAIVAWMVASGATAMAQECRNRGQLDTLYCDENNDLVADVPTDPKKLRDPSTLVFAYTPVEDPAGTRPGSTTTGSGGRWRSCSTPTGPACSPS